MKVCEEWDHQEFNDVLHLAESNASSDWDMSFVDGVRERYEKYGTETFLSDGQITQLRRIARI